MTDYVKTFHVSIDLDAELRKISQDQYLNDVHYIVQLIRHIMHHSPSEITIQNKPGYLRIHQNGDSINPDEWNLLLVLSNVKPSSDAEVHNAVAQVEYRFGIALLTLIRAFPHTEILNGDERLIVDNGRGRLQRSRRIDGYTVSVVQSKRDRRRELRELRYFCAECTVPIIYNGKMINEQRSLPDLILSTTEAAESGHGSCGIPRSGTLNTLHYRKTGIRYGTRSEIAEDGRIIRGDHNSNIAEFEPHYRASIKNANIFFHEASSRLYSQGLEQFSELSTEEKIRIKHLLFGIDDLTSWHHIPVFKSIRGRFHLTTAHISKLNAWFGFIPYSPSEDPSLPPFIPVLDYSDLRFIRNRMGHRVLLIATESCARKNQSNGNHIPDIQNRYVSDEATTKIPEENVLRFIEALNNGSVAYVFTVGTEWRVYESDSGIKYIDIPRDSNMISSYIKAWKNNPAVISIVRWKIIASVGTCGTGEETGKPLE